MENNDILLMTTARNLSSLKRKHQEKARKLGFSINKYYNPIFFQDFRRIDDIFTFTSKSLISYKALKEKENFSLSPNQKATILSTLLKIYNNGIFPMELKSDYIFITSDYIPVLFIPHGFVSRTRRLDKLYKKEMLIKRIEKFVNSL